MFLPDDPHRVCMAEEKHLPGEDRDFLDHARQISRTGYSSVFLSGGGLDCSRYSIACWDPVACLTAKGGGNLSNRIIPWGAFPLPGAWPDTWPMS